MNVRRIGKASLCAAAALALGSLSLPLSTPATAQDAPASAQASASCDEACLKGALDSFLAGLAAGDAARANLAQGARYTENGVPLPVGEGLWRTMDRVGSYRHSFFDTQTGQAGAFATIDENGVTQLLSLRIKVAAGKVSEAEVLVQRQQALRFINTEGLVPNPIWDQVVPPEKRVSRARLAEIANSYFDGLSRGSASGVPFGEECERYENGIQTAGVRRAPPPQGARPLGGSESELMRCAQQFDSGSTVYIQSVKPRRVEIVDEARGIVFGVFYFQHPGDITEIRAPDGTTRPMPVAAIRPFTVPAMEMFKVVGGKIVAIEAVAVTVPYGTPSPWN